MTETNTIPKDNTDKTEGLQEEQEQLPEVQRELICVSSEGSAKKFLNLLAEGWKLDPWLKYKTIDNGVIYHLMKINAKVYDLEDYNPEYTTQPKSENEGEKNILSVISVLHGETERYIEDGYEVYKIYQKDVVLVKRRK